MDAYRKNSLEWGSKARKEDSRAAKATDRQSLKKEANVNRNEKKPQDNGMMLSEIKYLKEKLATAEKTIREQKSLIAYRDRQLMELANSFPQCEMCAQKEGKSVHQLFSEEESKAAVEFKK